MAAKAGRFLLWLCVVGSALLLVAFIVFAVMLRERDTESGTKRRIHALLAASVGRVRSIGSALTMYAAENEGRLPPMQDTAEAKAALREYFRSDNIWRCRNEHNDLYQTNPTVSGKILTQLSTGTVLLYEPRTYDRRGRVVLFVGKEDDLIGSWLPEAQWQRQMNGSGSLDW